MKSLVFVIAVLFCGQAFGAVMSPQNEERTPSSIVEGIKKFNYGEFNRRVMFVRRGFDMVWKDRQFTPEQIIEAMGTDAVAMFTNHGNEQIALATLAQQNGIIYTPLAVPEGYILTPQQDGSIVVTKVEPQPEQPIEENIIVDEGIY